MHSATQVITQRRSLCDICYLYTGHYQNNTVKKIIYAALLFFPSLLCGQNWYVGVDILAPLKESFILDGKYRLTERIGIEARGGLLDPSVRRDEAFSKGYFVQAGPAFHLLPREQKSDVVVRVMGLFGRYQDPAWEESQLAYNERLRRSGVMLELAYVINLNEHFGMELYGGAGSVRHISFHDGMLPAYFSYNYRSGLPVKYENIPFPTGSHIPIDDTFNLAVTFGLTTFIRF